jgi:2Fe-2S ferredoxin
MIENYSLCLNELLRASCPPPFGPAELFKFAPGKLVRKNMAADLIHMDVMYASNAGAFTCPPFMQHEG